MAGEALTHRVSARHGSVLPAVLLLLLAACGGGAERVGRPVSVESKQAPGFPTAAFAAISESPVSEGTAATFLAALRDMAGESGMTATVMSADGTWSGAVGKADGVRDVGVDDQFAIGSVTKSVIAAQVMQLVEAGKLALDDPAADHLPSELDFDANGATIRQLLSHRSGILDYLPQVNGRLLAGPQRLWKPAELLELVPARAPVGADFEYSNTNYLLLRLVIEEVYGQPIAGVLRDGVLSIDGVERLIYQPAEVPTKPMAMPYGTSTAALKKGGGYLPSLAVTSDGGMASDSRSLARWWRAFCAGKVVSPASLTEMATFQGSYGLGLYSPHAGAVGHTGDAEGYVAWAGCLPEDGTVVVVLNNRLVEDIGSMARPLVMAALSESR